MPKGFQKLLSMEKSKIKKALPLLSISLQSEAKLSIIKSITKHYHYPTD